MTTIKNFKAGDKVRFNFEGAMAGTYTVTQVAKNRKFVWVEMHMADGFAYTVKMLPGQLELV